MDGKSVKQNPLTDIQKSRVELMQTAIKEKVDTCNRDGKCQYIAVHHGVMVPLPSDYDEVFPGILIGGEKLARDTESLLRNNVTHIINCAQGPKFGQVNTDEAFYKDVKISFLGIPGHDSVKFRITDYLHEAASFMKSCTSGKLLIHCHQGISRSAAVAIGCLMICHNLTAVDALKTIIKRRLIMPNNGFIRQLSIFEDQIFPK